MNSLSNNFNGFSNTLNSIIVLLISVTLFAGLGAADSIQAPNGFEESVIHYGDVDRNLIIDYKQDSIVFTAESLENAANFALAVDNDMNGFADWQVMYQPNHGNLPEGSDWGYSEFDDDQDVWNKDKKDQSFRDPSEISGVESYSYDEEDSTFTVEVDRDLVAQNGEDYKLGIRAYDAVKGAPSTYDYPEGFEWSGKGSGSSESYAEHTAGISIQDAVNTAESKSIDVVDIAAGTYDESVTIDTQGLTLEGPNAGTSEDGDREDEATIEGSISVDASEVTVDGVKLESQSESDTGRGLRVVGGDKINVKNSIVEGFRTGASHDFTGEAPSDITYESNLFIDNKAAIGSTEGVTDISIQDNTFEDNEEGVGLSGEEKASTVLEDSVSDVISNNEFEGIDLQEGERAVNGYYDGVSYDSEGNLIVDDDPSTSAPGTSIQDAVEFASDGDTIEVRSGQYSEFSVDKQLHIEGTGYQGDSKSVVETGDSRIEVKSGNVEISELKIKSTGGAGIYLNTGGAEGEIVLEDNYLLDTAGPKSDYSAIRSDNDADVSVIDNKIEGFLHGVLMGQFMNENQEMKIKENRFIDQGLDAVYIVAKPKEESPGNVQSGHEIKSNIIEGVGTNTPDIEEYKGIQSGIIIRASTQAETAIRDINIENNSFNKEERGILVFGKGEIEGIDATQNFWGEPSGPNNQVVVGDAVSGDISSQPWLLEADGERYDRTVSVEGGEWTLVSTPKALEENPIVNVNGVEDDSTAFETAAFNGTEAMDEGRTLVNPLNALYYRADNAAGIGFEYAEESGDPVEFDPRQLYEGWNLVGVAGSDGASEELSPLSDVATSFVSPKTNLKENDYDGDVFEAFPDKTVEGVNGYWVDLSESDSYSVPN